MESKKRNSKKNNEIELDNICILLTGTIKPAEGVFYLHLVDVEERKKQYENSLVYYLKATKIKKIVFCDNSGEELSSDLYRIAENNGKHIELLSFEADSQRIIDKGKGFGEGEIIEYVTRNSKLFNDSEFFIKITGRLIFRNINSCIKKMDMKKCYIDIYYDINGLLFGDTRTFAMNKEHYIHKILNAYQKVNDKQGQYLEHVIADSIIKNSINWSRMPEIIEMEGLSGSSGREYRSIPVELRKRKLAKLFLSMINCSQYAIPDFYLLDGMVLPVEMWSDAVKGCYGKRVILYGAGNIGIEFYKSFYDKCRIVEWVDSQYDVIKKKYNRRIRSPKVIKNIRYDLIVVAVQTSDVYKEIKNELMDKGIFCDITWARIK